MSWRRLHSRCSVPTAPRKYLVVTMVEALTLQKSGNSTPRCSKTTSPVFQLFCTTSRRSQVTSSYGCTPGVVKIRSTCSPVPRRVLCTKPAAGLVIVMVVASLVLDRSGLGWGGQFWFAAKGFTLGSK